MEVKLFVKGSDEQVSAFFESFLGREATTALLDHLASEGGIVREDFAEDPIYELLEEISWATFYLCDLLVVNGESTEDGGRILSYDELEDLGIKERSISSRIGGMRKVADRLVVDSVLTTLVRRGERRCKLDSEAVPVIEYARAKREESYSLWLEEKGLSKPSEPTPPKIGRRRSRS